MARKKLPASPPAGVPKWFLTYSDVVTLLMTFFILLLTFATDQPEVFEQMKTSMFGGRGSVGIAGDNLDSQDRESLTLRMRPNISRLTLRGTETPSMYSDPAFESLSRGLKALQERSDLAQLERMTFDAPLGSFVTDTGQLTSIAAQHLRLLAVQMRKMPVDVKFEVGQEADLPPVIDMCDLLTNGLKIPTGRISAAIVGGGAIPLQRLRITVLRTQ